MKMFFRLIVVAMLLTTVAGPVAADLISEFQANPPGADPDVTQIELSGTAGAAFSGFLTFIDTDTQAGQVGTINSSDAVSGIYDASGLAVIDLGFDVENPSYALVFSSAQPIENEDGVLDVDIENDLILDDASVFGTVFDAVGVIDNPDDATNFATVLGGVEFSTPIEFEVVFRDGSTGQFFGYDGASENIFDTTDGIFTAVDFTGDPTATSFGTVNSVAIASVPEPSSIAVLGLVGLTGLIRRRR